MDLPCLKYGNSAASFKDLATRQPTLQDLDRRHGCAVWPASVLQTQSYMVVKKCMHFCSFTDLHVHGHLILFRTYIVYVCIRNSSECTCLNAELHSTDGQVNFSSNFTFCLWLIYSNRKRVDYLLRTESELGKTIWGHWLGMVKPWQLVWQAWAWSVLCLSLVFKHQ